jgi:hypothetical protein
VAHLGGAAGDGVEGLKGGHQFTGTIDLDLDPPPAQGANEFRQPVGARAHAREVSWPGGDHLPLEFRLGGGPSRWGIRQARAQGQGTGAHPLDEVSALHVLSSSLSV